MVSLYNLLLYGLIVSLISVLSTLILVVSKNINIKYIVSFAAGSFLAAIFLGIFPKLSTNPETFPIVLISFILFALIEEFLHWHHHYHKHSIGILNLIGDFIHNFIDGLALASAFVIDETLGIVVLLSIILHEIPQEVGDLGILIYSGFSKTKAVLLNFAFSLSILTGIIVGWYTNIEHHYLLAIVAGSMLYISTVDIIPLLKKELKENERIKGFMSFILGILSIFLTKILFS